jgi:hypothetical protein
MGRPSRNPDPDKVPAATRLLLPLKGGGREGVCKMHRLVNPNPGKTTAHREFYPISTFSSAMK